MMKDISTIFFSLINPRFVNPLVILLFVLLIYGCTESNPSTVETPEITQISGSITTDTVWDIVHSPYIIEGDLLIEKDATLTLHPGVEVRFNGFYGLIVKGVFIADGIAEIQQPKANQGEMKTIPNTGLGKLEDNNIITFTSNSPDPKISDWKGITFQNTNDDRSLLKYVKVEFAKTGIEIFSSSPKIIDCIIINNNRGIQCVGSRSVIKNNLIEKNIIGITAREWNEIGISKNIITKNEMGVILPISKGIIAENNLVDNFPYAVKVISQKQIKLFAQYNWWGSVVIDDIEQQIYDKLDNSSLAQVIFIPFAESPFTDAGPRVPLVAN
jgi:hypothetical protein